MADRGRGGTPRGQSRGAGGPQRGGGYRGGGGGQHDGGGLRGRGDFRGRGPRGDGDIRGGGGRGGGGHYDGGGPRGRGDFRGRGPRGGGESRGGGGRGGGQRLGDDEYTRGPPIYSAPGVETTPSREIHEKEDEVIAKSKDLSLDTLTLADFKLPLRPGYGKAGTVIHLRTNYFAMVIDTKKAIHKYSVAIKAERRKRKEEQKKGEEEYAQEEPKKGRKQRQAFAVLFEAPEFRNVQPALATDYANTILTSKPLNLGPNGVKAFTIMYRDVEDQVARPNATRYTFTVSVDGRVPTQELLRYLASTTTDPSDFAGKADAVQALNIIVARTPNFNQETFQSGQNKFYRYPTDEGEYLDLSGGLIAVRGYYSSVRTSTMRTLLNLNAQASPFYPAVNMVGLMEQFGVYANQWLDLERFIEQLRVKTEYLKDEDGKTEVRVKTIVGFSHKSGERRDAKSGKMKRFGNAYDDHLSATQIKFDCSEFPEENPITVQQYFLKKHNIKLQKPNAWVLNCGTADKPTWIPPELCTCMPGQPYRGKLNERQTTNILNVAARPPAENARRIVGDGQQVVGIRGNGTSALAAFGVRINPSMVIVFGRVLQAPEVSYMNRGKSFAEKTAQAAWNMKGKQFSVTKPLTKWSFLKLGNVNFNKTHIDQVKQALRAGGLGESNPIIPPGTQGWQANVVLGQDDANDEKIKNVLGEIAKKDVGILLVILPGKGPITYARVKFWSDIRFGIRTVCVVHDKLDKGPQYFANVVLKFNLKNGGANQLLPRDKLGFLQEGSTMIVGIDVTHPAPKSMEGTPSIAAVVASLNGQYAQWPGSIRCQESKKEMVSALQEMMEERLEYWYSQNQNRCPRRILIYRDGVSEGQYKSVLEEEFDKQILPACRKIYQKYKANRPQINIVVVGKRHHTRFYPTEEKYADMNSRVKGNPPNGTVVDRGVTMERGWDFFLQAHVALQGTAKPAHYVVLLDEMKLGADELQGITHNLCYLFGRATRAVSICPPAYYADILCERGRCYLHKYINAHHPRGKVFDYNEAPWTRDVHPNLRNTMFYI